jgi:hypothetical protein
MFEEFLVHLIRSFGDTPQFPLRGIDSAIGGF